MTIGFLFDRPSFKAFQTEMFDDQWFILRFKIPTLGINGPIRTINSCNLYGGGSQKHKNPFDFSHLRPVRWLFPGLCNLSVCAQNSNRRRVMLEWKNSDFPHELDGFFSLSKWLSPEGMPPSNRRKANRKKADRNRLFFSNYRCRFCRFIAVVGVEYGRGFSERLFGLKKKGHAK